MISVICVYNDKKNFENQLLKSLKKQTVPYELIALDNSQNKLFSSAAAALNYAAKKAKNKYLLFIHQDIILPDKNWLKKAEEILNSLPDVGIAGAAGVDFQNKGVGHIDDGGGSWGRPFKKPQIAQTLDECLLIIPKKVFARLKFDQKNFDSWHCYGVDYCLGVQLLNLKVYTIPLFVYHNTLRTNIQNLLKYQSRVFEKHRRNNKFICTTCGFLSPSTLFLKSHFPKSQLVDLYWQEAGASQPGGLYLYKRLVRRVYRASIKRLRQFFKSGGK